MIIYIATKWCGDAIVGVYDSEEGAKGGLRKDLKETGDDEKELELRLKKGDFQIEAWSLNSNNLFIFQKGLNNK